MMSVMILRQFYERRKITEMKWIHEANNFVDFIIKSKSSSALKTMIDINRINLNTSEWVERATAREVVQITKRDIQIDEWDEDFEREWSENDDFQLFKEIRVLIHSM
jgi:hypothetical protein